MANLYPTDLSEEQWALIEPMIPPARPGGRPRTTDIRAVFNAILYTLRAGGGVLQRGERDNGTPQPR